MSALEALYSALGALRANKLRSALTMLGIFIGVGAVIAIVAVGSGAREQVLRQIRTLGSNLIVVFPGNLTSGGVRLGAGVANTLSEDDAYAIEREIAAVQNAAPTNRAGAQVVAGSANWATTVQGVTPAFFEVREWDVAAGRHFDAEEIARGAQVALLGQSVVASLFGDGDPVGETIRIRNVPFLVVGVLDRKGQNPQGQDQDDTIMVPLAAARQRVLGVNRANPRSVGAILVKIRDGEDMTQAEADIRDLLRQRHRLQPQQDDDFTIRNLTEIVATRMASARTLALLLVAVAGVSLLVGGIGIMNIMLVSVTERTREIGLRMAVGARPRDILRQFLIEATALSVLGGAAGVLAGIAIAAGVAMQAGWPLVIGLETVVLAVAFSALVGMFFGWYPAHRAARLDPIEALRHA
ncbi:MAG: ABC transporter permease [Azospirillum sp.]|jgi:putative ABC transport system permease protein|nr:ABC transporter permease [Azospirillum sp.]MCA3268646.1 ABC transporter permease [Azospirillum sp.]MCZ8122948.1 ABC transporter permease [Magnetospirillum sp.]